MSIDSHNLGGMKPLLNVTCSSPQKNGVTINNHVRGKEKLNEHR